MMQDVATANSDIAAFASSFRLTLRESVESNQNFDQVMQDQKDKLAQQQNGKKKPVEQTLGSKVSLPEKANESKAAESIKTPKVENAEVYRNDTSNQTRNNDSEKVSVEAKGTEPRTSSSAGPESTTNQNTEAADVQLQEQSNEVTQDLLLLNSDKKNTTETVSLTLPESQSNTESNISASEDAEKNEVVAEEWLALVENYQKFTEMALAANKLNGEEQSVDLKLEKILPENIDKDLLKKIAENQLIYKMDGSAKISEQADIESLVGKQNLDALKVVDDSLHKINQTEIDKANISLLVQQALEQLNANPEAAETSDQQTQQTAELLLANPQISESVHKALKNIVENNTVDVNGGKDMLKENTALLQTLLTNNQSSEKNQTVSDGLGSQELTLSALAKSKPAEAESINQSIIDPEGGLSAKITNEILIEAEDSRNIALKNTPALEKNLQGNAKVVSDISALLELSDKKLVKVLEHIAGQVIPSHSAADGGNLEQDTVKQNGMLKTADLVVTTNNQTKDFISALKSGIEEFKQQLAQGREPGLDLKALISDAMAKSTEAVVNKPSVNIQQISQSITQVLDFAQSINRAIEHHQEQTYSAVQRDAAQIQGEQSKSLQFNQFEAKFEKAVNITKPEGHQQLAEKVRWMVNTKNLVADIRLDPAELGSVHVKVSMSGESATVNFVVQSQHARDAMDNATPRLRDMLAEKGIELGQSSVEQESKGQSEGELSQQGRHNQEFDSDPELPEQVIAQQTVVNGALGGIDYFV